MDCKVCGRWVPRHRVFTKVCSKACSDALKQKQKDRHNDTILSQLLELKDIRIIARSVGTTMVAVESLADEMGIKVVPSFANFKMLKTVVGGRSVPQPRNQLEAIRLMIDQRYATTASRAVIRKRRRQHEQMDAEAAKVAGDSQVPCNLCRDDVWDYCANTGTECQAFEVWASRGVIGSRQAKQQRQSVVGW